MQHEIASSPDVQLHHEPSWCAAASCSASAAIDFAGRALCLEHFLPACITEIESRNERLRNLPFDPSATEALKTFIATCAQQAETLAANAVTHRPEQLTEKSAEDSRFTRSQMKSTILDFLLRLLGLRRRTPGENLRQPLPQVRLPLADLGRLCISI